jgi:hypothetical protein
VGLADAQVYHIAGGYLVDENDEVVDANQTFTFGHHVLDFDVEEGFGWDRIGELGGFAGHKLFAVRGTKLQPAVAWTLRVCPENGYPAQGSALGSVPNQFGKKKS